MRDMTWYWTKGRRRMLFGYTSNDLEKATQSTHSLNAHPRNTRKMRKREKQKGREKNNKSIVASSILLFSDQKTSTTEEGKKFYVMSD